MKWIDRRCEVIFLAGHVIDALAFLEANVPLDPQPTRMGTNSIAAAIEKNHTYYEHEVAHSYLS